MFEVLLQLFSSISTYALELGYFGAFILGFLSTFTLFIPSPSFFGVVTLATTGIYNPLLLGIMGGMGATLGEIVGFGVGFGGHELMKKKYSKTLENMEVYFQKYGGFVLIFIFAATPLPFDVVGIFCGTVKYPFRKFIIATFLGKLVKYLFLAYAGFYGIQWIITLING